jgi:hypothetical protein
MVVIHGSSCELKTRRYAMAAASDTRIVGFRKANALRPVMVARGRPERIH